MRLSPASSLTRQYHVDVGPTPFRWTVEGFRQWVRASSSGAANLIRALLVDGSRVEGMVFPGELFWDGDSPPLANAELVCKRR